MPRKDPSVQGLIVLPPQRFPYVSQFERKQYGQLLERHHGNLPSDLYGAEHFLRFFGATLDFLLLVQIGSFIDASMPEATVRLLKDCAGIDPCFSYHSTLHPQPLTLAGRLLDFLAEHPAWFEEEYEPAPASYIKAMALVSA